MNLPATLFIIQYTGGILHAIYIIVTSIILLNMLIAAMLATYESIQVLFHGVAEYVTWISGSSKIILLSSIAEVLVPCHTLSDRWQGKETYIVTFRSLSYVQRSLHILRMSDNSVWCHAISGWSRPVRWKVLCKGKTCNGDHKGRQFGLC